MKFLQSPETFTVEEIPLYEPSGNGEHLYVAFKRRGLSTPFILRSLERRLHLREADLGKAGNKDRDATTIQTISLPARLEEAALGTLEEMGAEILSARRHPHKLRTGKLAGNRFLATVELESPEEAGVLNLACARITKEGLPNAFGPQRFGDGKAVGLGRLLFTGRRPTGSFRRARFAVSAFQSFLFNRILEVRRELGFYPTPMQGDLMKKHATGGEFVAGTVDDTLLDRVGAFEISPTGPLPGRKAPKPEGEALALERRVLAGEGVDDGVVLAAKAPGTRRFLRIPVGSLKVSTVEESERKCARLAFALPPGV